MIAPLVVALALASPALDVPFVPQSTDLCGGAAVAMVFRFWGDRHADAQQFAPLIDREARGIRADVLIGAVKARGWMATPLDGTLVSVRQTVEQRQPIVVLLEDRRNRYHYVVVTGITDHRIVVHDPSWGPSRE